MSDTIPSASSTAQPDASAPDSPPVSSVATSQQQLSNSTEEIESVNPQTPDSSVVSSKKINSDSPLPSELNASSSSASEMKNLLKRAQASLRQTVKRYVDNSNANATPFQSDIQQKLEHIVQDLQKLENGVLRIAVFGLVSRGKSSVINALIEQKALQTGPLHGVTKWPRSVYWEPKNNQSTLRVEFIDTPGLDEVDGTIRADMANEVAQEADLILFVLAGEITPIEYQALVKLLTQRKPLMIVCNKMDLYPEQNGEMILSGLGDALKKINAQKTQTPSSLARLWQLTPEDVVQAAAAPTPIQVRVEWPDGQITHEWEYPPAKVDALSRQLSQILHQDGPMLIALNALRDSQLTEAAIASNAMQVYDTQAEDLLWQFAKWKGLAVAANPIAILDVAGGVAADLVMIRSLARLYGLPMTGYDAGALWNAIVWSSGGLLAAELGSKILLGVGKTTALMAGALGGLAAYSSTAIAQGTLAGYGAYRVGRAAQVYLQQGCTWGPHGASTVIQTILEQTRDSSIVTQLKEELSTTTAQWRDN
ncbi:MAG: GTP-binding protein [Cyanobacteria bacterium P01_F01_bin.150]